MLLFAGLLAPRAAQASHALGSDMSYVSVSPGVYYVQFRFYRDCMGPSGPASFPLRYEATGCGPSGAGTNTGGTVTLLPRASQVANPYCRSQNSLSPCDSLHSVPSNSYPNYNIYSYGGVVTLGSGSRSECSNWVLSTDINTRPDTRNLGIGTDLYTCARLDNRYVQDESSPAFSTLGGLQPLAVMYPGMLVRYNGAVVDPDGDSLVYSLQQPLSGYNTPIPYVNGHSLQYPIRLKPGTTAVHIDRQGTLEFTPDSLILSSLNDEDNKFVFVIQVEAYRRVSGGAIRVSTVRRELTALMIRAGSSNLAPALNGPDVLVTSAAGSQMQTYGDTIFAFAGESLAIQVPLRDFNGDSVFVEMPSVQSPSGSAMTTTGYAQIQGVMTRLTADITWTPTAADVRAQAHPFYLRVRDNSCPSAASVFYPLSVVVAAARPLGLASARGAHHVLRAAPNPFSGVTRLTVQASANKATAVQIYDLKGRLVDHLPVPAGVGAHELTWHAPAALPVGVYVARHLGANGPQSTRLVKQ